MAVTNLLVTNGVSPKHVTVIGVGSSAGAYAAVKNGLVDAIANLDPVMSKLEADGAIVVVVDTRTSKGMSEIYGGEYHAGSIYTQPAWVKKHPNTAQAVVSAVVRALLWVRSASVDDIVAAVPRDFYGSEPAIYKIGLQKNREGFSPDGLFTMQAARNVYKVLRQFLPEVQKASIDLTQTFDNRFVEAALKKYNQ